MKKEWAWFSYPPLIKKKNLKPLKIHQLIDTYPSTFCPIDAHLPVFVFNLYKHVNLNSGQPASPLITVNSTQFNTSKHLCMCPSPPVSLILCYVLYSLPLACAIISNINIITIVIIIGLGRWQTKSVGVDTCVDVSNLK